MKKLFLLIAILLPINVMAFTVEQVILPDTTIYVEGKKIELRDGEDRMKVRVYDIRTDGSVEEDELVFEGHYRDGQSYEKRKYAKAITIPLPTWTKGFDPHWAGVSLGFANFADSKLNVNDIDGVSLDSGKSWELNINFLEYDIRLSRRYGWALVTGMGIRWDRYRVDGDYHFKRVDGHTVLQPAPPRIHYRSSKLNTTSLTIPLLLEWQNLKRRSADFFISAGVVGVIKTASTSRVSYRDINNEKVKAKMDKGLYIRPISMDFLIQAGLDWIGIYAKYSPFELFENNKGPAIHPVAIGLQLHF